MSRDRDGSRHGPLAQLLIALSPLSAILVAYWAAQWVSGPLASGAATNRLGAGVHVDGPAAADAAVFGAVPSVVLQSWFAGDAPRWWDAVAALVYVTHYLAIPLVTALVWFRLRERFRAWIVAVLTTTLLGTVGYVLYPAAPPWFAADAGRIGAVDRLSTVGWDPLGLGWLRSLLESAQAGSNPVAAVPSLHAGAALLVALFLLPSVRRVARTALLAYAGLMALVLVYTGEHYVVDVVLGWAVALCGTGAGVLVARRARRTDPAEPPRRPVERVAGR